MQEPICKMLNDYVIANGLSRKVIAANMKISEPRLSLMLNGKRRLTIEDYVSFCNAIAVSPMRFIRNNVS